MPRYWILGVVCLIAAADLPACGDKYLAIGRGARFQRGYVSLRPVSIAVLKHAATAEKAFLSRLKLAGHRVETVDDVDSLGERLAKSKFDVVLADYDDAANVQRSLQTVTAKPLFLPVVKAGSPKTEAAQREYGCLLNAPSKSMQRNFLIVLDEAVASSRNAQVVRCALPDR